VSAPHGRFRAEDFYGVGGGGAAGRSLARSAELPSKTVTAARVIDPRASGAQSQPIRLVAATDPSSDSGRYRVEINQRSLYGSGHTN